jgi:hypothetical protein
MMALKFQKSYHKLVASGLSNLLDNILGKKEEPSFEDMRPKNRFKALVNKVLFGIKIRKLHTNRPKKAMYKHIDPNVFLRIPKWHDDDLSGL